MLPTIPSGNVTSGLATGYEVANSCRFDQASSSYMNKTYGSGNRRKFTFSTWIKRCNTSARTVMYNCYVNSTNYEIFFLHADGYLEFDAYHGSQIWRYKSNALFRDPSAFYHFMFAVDTEHDTASSRVRFYVNGSEITSFSTETNPSEDYDMMTNESGKVVYLGRNYNGSSASNMYLAETVFIDGSQLTPSSFGEFDEDSPTIWKPIDVSGLTFGTNGFYLDYEDSANLGNDANGGTDLTETNLAAADQATDTPTNNFATLNPLTYGTNYTWSEGNTVISQTSGAWDNSMATIGVDTGKWYWEVKADGAGYWIGGITDSTVPTSELGPDSGHIGYKTNGEVNKAGSVVENFTTWTDGDILCVALDKTNNNIYFRKNDGSWEDSGDPTSGATGTGAISLPTTTTIFPAVSAYRTSGTTSMLVNFGGSSGFAVSSGNADANGYGNFEYAVPSGFYSLCTKNLAEYG